jgi:hypothetical protein
MTVKILAGAIEQLTPWIFTFILVGMSSTRRQPDRTRPLVEVGFEEIYRHGFQPAGLDTIVERAGVTQARSTTTSRASSNWGTPCSTR